MNILLWLSGIGVLGIASIFLWCLAKYIGEKEGDKYLKVQAVKRGFGSWETDESGNVWFAWKENREDKT